MARGDLAIDIIARDRASAAFGKVAGSASKTSKTIKAGATVAAVGFAAVAAGAIKLAQGAAEDQKSAAALAKTLENSAHATKGQVSAVEDWITAQGKAVGISDDQLRPSLAALVTATGKVGKAQRLASLAMDISAGTGKSLQAVTSALVKAQNGSVGGLSRLGVATKDAAGKTKSFADIQDELKKKFGGQAAVAADTAAGRIQRFKVALSEAGESIGYALIPALTSLGAFLNGTVIPALNSTITWTQNNATTAKILAGVVFGLGAAFILASAAIKAYTVISKVARAVTIVWTNAQWALNIAFSANPIGVVIIAIVALVAAIVIAYKKSQTFRNIVTGAFNAVKSAASAVGKAFKDVYDGVTKWLGKAWTYIQSLPGKISGAFSGIWSGLAGGLKSAINSVLHLPLTIPRVNTHIPGVGTVGGQTLIPALAKGGIVTQPTIALIGEAGPEAVVPLNKSNSGLSMSRRDMQILAGLISAGVAAALNDVAKNARTA